MSTFGEALLAFGVGDSFLACALGDVRQVLPSAQLCALPITLDLPGFVGMVATPGGPVPVVAGSALFGIVGAPPLAQMILILRNVALGVTVSRVGDVMEPGKASERPLPAWLATHCARAGVIGIAEHERLWPVISWTQEWLGPWLNAWQSAGNMPNKNGCSMAESAR